MAPHVCPWWMGYFLINPLRRYVQPPAKILKPLVRAGMTVVDIGSGMGFFSLDAARLAGPDGRVVCVDLQPKMIQCLKRRAERAGLSARIEPRLCAADSLGVDDLKGKVDVALTFAVAHEVPDRNHLFRQIRHILKPEGRLLLAEPRGRVTQTAFEETVAEAEGAGFRVIDRPAVFRSRAVLLISA